MTSGHRLVDAAKPLGLDHDRCGAGCIVPLRDYSTAVSPTIGEATRLGAPIVQPLRESLFVLAEPAVGEAWAGAAHMAPGADVKVEVAPRLVRPAPGQVAVLASQLNHPDATGSGPSSLPLL